MIFSDWEGRKYGENGRGTPQALYFSWMSERLLGCEQTSGAGEQQGWGILGRGEDEMGETSFRWITMKSQGLHLRWPSEQTSQTYIIFPETQRGQLTCFRSDSESQCKFPNLSISWTLYGESLPTSLLSKFFVMGQETRHTFTSCSTADDVFQRVLSL